MQALEKLSGSNRVTLVWMDTWAHGIVGNKEADKLARDSTNGIPSDQIVGIPFFVVGKEVLRSHLRQEHLNRWKTCKGCRQSKTLMSDSLPRSTKEFQAMSKQKLKGLWSC